MRATLGVVLALSACAPAPTGASPERASVVSVADGDTLTVDVEGGTVVRLDGINAPERGECLADRAREELAGLVADGVEVDGAEHDQYGRLLAELIARDGSVNETLVRRGLAISTASGPDPARMRSAEAEARAAGHGMWDPEACGTGPLPPVAIVRIEADPSGPDGEPGSDEEVVVVNAGRDPVDLSGWVLRDESSVHRFVFPGGTRLADGDRIRVTSACGSATPGTVSWCTGAVWNNAGDTAFLLDPSGRIVSWFRYAP